MPADTQAEVRTRWEETHKAWTGLEHRRRRHGCQLQVGVVMSRSIQFLQASQRHPR